MGEIMVLAEHREGELREISLQMLNKASELCRIYSHDLSVVLIGSGLENLIKILADRAKRIIVYNDERLTHFNPDYYEEILAALINERKPLMIWIGHTPWGMDLAPALAVKTGYPLATDCVDIMLDSDRPRVIRQVYSGKIFIRMTFRHASSYLVTVRGGVFSSDKSANYQAEIINAPIPPIPEKNSREFIGYRDTGKGEVDICQASLLVSIGRGIGDKENIEGIKELGDLMGGLISCSRPVVDKKWLPKYHQVGTSGKTVKPKVYLALGISGAFQHVAGISGAGTVIAVNKDKKAPIFRVADYGVVADLHSIVASIKEKLRRYGVSA
jgi:electron transfer flavoprotein alpha subunit